MVEFYFIIMLYFYCLCYVLKVYFYGIENEQLGDLTVSDYRQT